MSHNRVLLSLEPIDGFTISRRSIVGTSEKVIVGAKMEMGLTRQSQSWSSSFQKSLSFSSRSRI